MLRVLRVAVFVFGWLSAAAIAQVPANPPEVAGHVRDPSGLPIPGAQLSLIHESTKQRWSAVSEFDGSFRFSGVPEGRAALEATAPGFAPFRSRIEVRGEPQPVSIRLEIENLTEEITIDEADPNRPSVDPAGNLDSTPISREELDALPALDQDVLSVASEFLDDGALGGGGAVLVVDGIESERLGVTSSTVAQVRINKNPYSAEYSRPGRGRIEVLTKQGSSDYHGEVTFGVRDYRFDARNAFAEERPLQRRRRLEGHLTGPLGRSGKNTFLISAERDVDNQQSIIFARTLGGPLSETFPRPQHETELSARFNRYLGDTQMWSLRYSGDREAESGGGVGGFALPEAAYDQRESSHGVRFDHKWFGSAKWFTDFSINLERDREHAVGANNSGPRIVVLDSFTGGSAQRDSRESETEFEMSFVTSWMLPKHSVRAGFLVPRTGRQALNGRDNFGGTFRFSSLADFEAGRPFSFTQRSGRSDLTFWSRQLAGFVQDDIRLGDNLNLGLGVRYEWQNYLSDRNNFAPRASLAWGVGKQRKTILRAGSGIFYDRLGSGEIRDTLLLNGLRLKEVLIDNPSFPDAFAAAGSVEELPASVVRFDPALRAPYLIHYNFGVETELRNGTTLAATYTGIRGNKLLRSLDRNAPLGPHFDRPNPSFTEVRELESAGTLKSRALNLQLRGRPAHWFRGTVLYTLGQSYDDTGGEDGLPPNSYDLRGQWARAGFDRRHRLRLLGNIELPWRLQLGTIFTASSGQPYEWTTGTDANLDGRAAERPAGVGRNALQAAAISELDLRLSREFSITPRGGDGPTITLMADAFNALNQVNYRQFVGNENSPFFRRPVSADSARRLQFTVRFGF